MLLFEIKRGSTWPPLDARLNLDVDTGLTDCSVSLRILNQDGGLLLDAPMTILDEVTQHVRYEWSEADTAIADNYWFEVWVQFQNGRVVKLPINEYGNLVIYEDK